MTPEQIQQAKQWIKDNQDDLIVTGIGTATVFLGMVGMYYIGKSRGSLVVEIMLKPKAESPYIPIPPFKVR